MIGISIEKWYTEYIVILGLVSAPIVATYLYDIVLRQKSNISNIIANTFKVVVSGVNILIFTHLIVILIAYSKYIKTESGITKIMTKSIVSFLPVYIIWSLFVITILPFIFNFK